MSDRFILSIDQGTSSTKCLLVDETGDVVATASASLGEHCPSPGWVEQDAEAIWTSVREAVATAMVGYDPKTIAAVGLSTQRESILLWDKATGNAISPLLSWQDQRTTDLGHAIGTAAIRKTVRAISGLPLDPMFSALKARWLLDRFDPDRTRSKAGQLALGTVDSWLCWKLGGSHQIEIGNASRTQLLDTARGVWSDELCAIFAVPMNALPCVTTSTGPFPCVRGLTPLLDGTPVMACLGDSHAALFGHGVRAPGAVKATFGTGSSVMGLIGPIAANMDDGTCLTVAWQIGDAPPQLAAEGNIRSAGSTLRWLADVFDISVDALVSEGFASEAGTVQLVPAFNGLGAPYWDDEAEAVLSGFKLGTPRGAVFAAAIRSIAHQVADVAASVEATIGQRLERLHADGGPSTNEKLMQLQADLAAIDVVRPRVAALSAYGAARLAGVGAGFWSLGDGGVEVDWSSVLAPSMDENDRLKQRERWRHAIRRARLSPEARHLPRPQGSATDGAKQRSALNA